MFDPIVCPSCRGEVPADDKRTPCSICGRSPRSVLPIPPGPRLASLMDALPAEDDRLTTRPTVRREVPPTRPKLHAEEIESPADRARAKGSMAFEIALGLFLTVAGLSLFVGGLAFGMLFKYPVVLLIGGIGLIVDGVRRKVR